MTITASLFEAFLKCPTKCWLRANSEAPGGNTYAEWVRSQNESFRASQTERLLAETPPGESVRSPGSSRGDEVHFSTIHLKSAKWCLAVDIAVAVPDLPRSSRREEAHFKCGIQNAECGMESQSLVTSAATDQAGAPPPDSALRTPHSALETRLHAVERVPAEGRGKAAQFIPIRFVFFNKLGKDDKLLLAFDAFVLSAALGRDIAIGKIIHGDRGCARESAANPGSESEAQDGLPTSAAFSRAQPRGTKVKTSALAGEVQKHLEKIAALLSSPTPPDLVLNRHCGECEFQARCRKIALEKDDLSLLGASARRSARNSAFISIGRCRRCGRIRNAAPKRPLISSRGGGLHRRESRCAVES